MSGSNNMKRTYERLVSRMRSRIADMINRAIITRVDTSGGVTLLQVRTKGGQLHDGIEYFEPYGFTSTPHVQAEVLLICLGGFRIATCANDRRYRFKNWADGEVGLYTFEGDYIHLKNGRVIEVVAGAQLQVTAPVVDVIASTSVTLTTPETEITGNLTVGGNATIGGNSDVTGAVTSASLATVGVVTAAGGVSSSGVNFDTHTHGGVQSGASNTGGPQ